MSNLDFIAAKIRGMRGKLLEGARLNTLCETANIEDLAANLAPKKPIGDVAALQRAITQDHVASLNRIAGFLTNQNQLFLNEIIRRYQLENLRVMIRGKSTKAKPETITKYIVPMPPQFKLPVSVMIQSDSMDTALGLIPLDSYREAAFMGLNEYKQTGRTFYIEAGIDKTYYSALHSMALQLSGESAEKIKKLVFREIDIYNIMFTLRAAYNYGLQKNRINSFLAPFCDMSLRQLEGLYDSKDIDEASGRVPGEFTGNHADSVEQLEIMMWKNIYRMANSAYYSSGASFGSIVAFFYIKRAELANLIRISECIRYGEKPEQIKAKLIVPAALAGAQ